MDDHSLDQMLAEAAPPVSASLADNPGFVDDLLEETRASRHPRKRKTLTITSITLAVALVGGTAAAAGSDLFAIWGVQPRCHVSAVGGEQVLRLRVGR